MIPVWFCIVKVEMISDFNGFQGYRIIKSIPTTSDKYAQVWDTEMRPLVEYGGFQNNYHAMLFIRELDANPVKDAYMKGLQDGRS